MSSSNLLYFNGVNGSTGQYELPPMDSDALLNAIKGESQPENIDELKFRKSQSKKGFGVKAGVDRTKIEESGWGVIFPHDANPAIIEALQPLLNLRKQQAGELFRIYAGGEGYRPNESKTDFLERYDMGPGPVDPEIVPYYLLIVGDPQRIPYMFQYQLDVQYAVGRIHFDTIEEYHYYAQTVVAAEKGEIQLPRDIALFGPANHDDQATQLSAEYLLNPIADYIQKEKKLKNWQVNQYLKEQATKSQLSELLGGASTPALLFTASHGMAFSTEDKRQLRHQGALLCQNWPGPQTWREAIPQDHYFAADDLTRDAKLAGLISFHFACYGAGTPHYDNFAKQAFQDRPDIIAPHDFLAQLPCKMLSHSRGGALAAIGHVDRAWGYSFLWDGVGAQTTVFTSTLHEILQGYPVGTAFEYFNQRYAELSSDLIKPLEDLEYKIKVKDPYKLAGMWTANNDARSYIIIGDPAVRLPVTNNNASIQARSNLELNTVNSATTTTANDTSSLELNTVNSATITTVNDTSTPQPRTTTALPSPQDVDYGLFDMGRNITSALKNISQKVTQVLSDTASDLSTMEIQTYTCDNLDDIGKYDQETGKFTGEAKLQAYTRIKLDGDHITVVPQIRNNDKDPNTPVAPSINQELWEIHKANVAQAQANRQAFVKNVLEVVGDMMKIIK